MPPTAHAATQLPSLLAESHLANGSDWEFLRRTDPVVHPLGGHRLVRAVDLFCGCGGLSLGAREACDQMGRSLRVAWAVDSDPQALRVYADNLSPNRASCVAIQEILDGELGRALTPRERDLLQTLDSTSIDLLMAGPPCQGHSNLNNRTRHRDDRNMLYGRIARFAEIAEPRHILIENVPSVVVGREGMLYRTVEHLRKLGYEVELGTVDLSRIGVPQRRKRHIVLASHSKAIWIEKIVHHHRVPETRTVAWAIRDLEYLEGEALFDRPSLPSRKNLERIRYLFSNKLFDLPNHLRPPCHQKDGHTYKSMYGRLRWDEPAQTITSGYGSPGQGRYIHPARPRTLTPHEAARLQLFPDFFDFSSVRYKNALARMIGNAVPPKLAMIFTWAFLT